MRTWWGIRGNWKQPLKRWKRWTPGSRALSDHEAAGRRVDYYRRPRERGDDDRSGNGRAPHLSHDQPGAIYFGERAGQGEIEAGRVAAGHCPDDARSARAAEAGGHDRHGFADGFLTRP